MAVFNPGPGPSNDPNFLNYSQGVSPQRNIEPTGVQPTTIHPTGVTQSDQSGAYFGKGIGQLISGVGQELDLAGKEADTIVKKSIDDKLFSALDAERTRYDASLQALTQATPDQAVRPGTTGKFTLTGVQNAVYGGGEAAIPQPLGDQLPTQLKTIADAFESGKVSPTFYYGRLNEIAKQFRSQYPGYREYIDQEVKQITGVDPANAKITSLTSQINTALAQARSEQSKIDTFFQRKEVAGLPGAPQIYEQYKAGQIGLPQVQRWYSKYENIRYVREEALEQIKLLEGSTKAQSIIAEQKFNTYANKEVAASLNSYELSSGVGNFQQVMLHLNNVATGRAEPLAPEQYQKLATDMMSYTKFVEGKLRDTAMTDGYLQIMGPAKTNELITAYTQPMRDLAGMIVNKETGPAFLASRYIQAVQDGDVAKLQSSNTPTADMLRKLKVIQSMAGPNTNILQLPGIEKFIGKNGLDALDSFKLDAVTNYATQPNLKNAGEVKTVRDDIDRLISKGVNDPSTFDDLLNIVTKLPNLKSEDMQKNYALAMFSKGILDMNWKDSQGRDIRSTLMNKFTAPDVSNMMYKLGQGDPNIWTMYKNWVYDAGINIAKKDILNLNSIQMQPDIKIGWDSDNYKMSVLYKGIPVPLNPSLLPRNIAPGTALLKQYQQQVDNVNSITQALAGIKEKESGLGPGSDVETQLLGMLQYAGWNINPQSVTGLSDAMIEAIKASRAKQEKEGNK